MTAVREQLATDPWDPRASLFRVQIIPGTAGPEHVDLRIVAPRGPGRVRRIGTLCCTPHEAQALIDLFGEVPS